MSKTPKRRTVQFTIRTMIVIVGVTALAMGCISWLGIGTATLVLALVGAWVGYSLAAAGRASGDGGPRPMMGWIAAWAMIGLAAGRTVQLVSRGPAPGETRLYGCLILLMVGASMCSYFYDRANRQTDLPTATSRRWDKLALGLFVMFFCQALHEVMEVGDPLFGAAFCGIVMMALGAIIRDAMFRKGVPT